MFIGVDAVTDYIWEWNVSIVGRPNAAVKVMMNRRYNRNRINYLVDGPIKGQMRLNGTLRLSKPSIVISESADHLLLCQVY